MSVQTGLEVEIGDTVSTKSSVQAVSRAKSRAAGTHHSVAEHDPPTCRCQGGRLQLHEAPLPSALLRGNRSLHPCSGAF